MNQALRTTLFILSGLGTIVCGALSGASGSGTLPALIFGLSGCGLALVFIYYLIVHEGVENKK